MADENENDDNDNDQDLDWDSDYFMEEEEYTPCSWKAESPPLDSQRSPEMAYMIHPVWKKQNCILLSKPIFIYSGQKDELYFLNYEHCVISF